MSSWARCTAASACAFAASIRAWARARASATSWWARATASAAGSTGFGTDWLDYDNDGWLDLFVANGAVNTVEAQRGQASPFRMRNQLFHNTGGGRFIETTAAAGPAFARAEIGRGAAFGDVDNDGDVRTDHWLRLFNVPAVALHYRLRRSTDE